MTPNVLRRITSDWVEAYLQEDDLAGLLDEVSSEQDERLVCQTWLRKTAPKRLIFRELYGDLLNQGGRGVLDVGGGLTALTRLMAERNTFELVDLLAHDDQATVDSFLARTPDLAISRTDWLDYEIKHDLDIVVANDLFPNVDQRLEMFLEKFLPRCQEVRLSLTYYNEPRSYLTRRLNGDEILCMLAWDGALTARCLAKFGAAQSQAEVDLLQRNDDSAYQNGRQVSLIAIEGYRRD
ncbi:hypothetical protein [Ferruginivarius sediminum]|uniref:Class I SAM-dependent methyltransferase n=1 Tax=Ferruginivarius sediminum TaxID=2661937 RepID=A0A369THG5_9PROT|nr:hypothetical protein [Ferruginivarius sediminum]RDD63567.1 hypothetical protein DRB17_03780 [Ferruginivarius sediminum]